MSAAPRLLLVDDEADILNAMAGYLRLALPRAELHLADDGAQALKVLESQAIDVLVTDYKMPGIDGLQLLREVRRRWPGLACVLLTAFPDMQLAINAVNEGRIRQFLTKPVEPDRLRDVVSRLLEEQHGATQREQALRRAARAGP